MKTAKPNTAIARKIPFFIVISFFF